MIPRRVTATEVQTLFIAFLVGVAHLVSGVVIFLKPGAAIVAPYSLLAQIADSFGVWGSGVIGITLMVAGFMAIIGGTCVFVRRVHVWLFVPQQIILLLQILAISVTLVEGKYPDGYIPVDGSWFILSDQIWAWVLAVSHSIWLIAFIFGGARRGTNSR